MVLVYGREGITLENTKTRIILATLRAVRRYGLEGVRIQNVSELAGVSSGAIYRHFDGKEHLLIECFKHVDQQVAALFEHLKFHPLGGHTDLLGAIKRLWLPYFRFWTSHPDETIFYHRFRDSAFFSKYVKSRDADHFKSFLGTVHVFKKAFSGLDRLHQDLLWFHVLTSTVLYAKYVIEGTLPNQQETEDASFSCWPRGLAAICSRTNFPPWRRNEKRTAEKWFGAYPRYHSNKRSLLPGVKDRARGSAGVKRPDGSSNIARLVHRWLHGWLRG